MSSRISHLKPWRNNPQNSVWCYKSEAGTGEACNIPEDGVLPEGQRKGFNGNLPTCAVEPPVSEVNDTVKEVKIFQCPAEFHLKPWRNEPQNSVWCYKSEAGTGQACNIPEDGVLPEGQRKGFNGNLPTCAVETKPLEPEPIMCTIPQTTWINSKMGNNGWTQAQGEGAQNCTVPSNLQSRITNVMCTIPQTTWINSKMGNDGWTQAQGEGAQKCKVPSNLQSRITN